MSFFPLKFPRDTKQELRKQLPARFPVPVFQHYPTYCGVGNAAFGDFSRGKCGKIAGGKGRIDKNQPFKLGVMQILPQFLGHFPPLSVPLAEQLFDVVVEVVVLKHLRRGKNTAAVIGIVLRQRGNISVRKGGLRQGKFEVAASRRHVPDAVGAALETVFSDRLDEIFVRLGRKRNGRVKFPLEPPREILAEAVDLSADRKDRPLVLYALIYAPEIVILIHGQALGHLFAAEGKFHAAPAVELSARLDVGKEIFRQFPHLAVFAQRFGKQGSPIFVNLQKIIFVYRLFFAAEQGQLNGTGAGMRRQKRRFPALVFQIVNAHPRERLAFAQILDQFRTRRKGRAFTI